MKTFLSHINLAFHTNIVQIRIHCSYQKIQVFYLTPNFSLQLYSFYGCIAHFVSDLVLNPEYRFSRAMTHIKPIEKSIKIHVLLYTIQGCLYYVRLLLQKMSISSHCTIAEHAYGTYLNGYANFSSLFLCALNVAILGKLKSKL